MELEWKSRNSVWLYNVSMTRRWRKDMGGVSIIMPSWDSTCAMCKTRRWRKDMGVVCIMGGVCIMAPNLTSSGPPPPWLIIMPMTSPFSYIYMCSTIDNAEVAFFSILIICLSDYFICDPGKLSKTPILALFDPFFEENFRQFSVKGGVGTSPFR